MSRNWKNYLTDINQRVADLTETEHDEDADDESRELAIMQLPQLQRTEKAAIAVRKFCAKVTAHGLNSLQCLECYEQQINWCNTVPTVDCVFSEYTQQVMHTVKCQESWPAQIFVDKLDPKPIAKFLPQSEIPKYQEKCMATRSTS